MKVINLLIDNVLSNIILYLFPNCKNFEELKCLFRINIDKKNSNEIRKLLNKKYNELYNFLHEELSSLNINDYKNLLNNLSTIYNGLSLSDNDKRFIYDELLLIEFCLTYHSNLDKLIFVIKKIFICIVCEIIFSYIKRYILKYLEDVKMSEQIRKRKKYNSINKHKKNIVKAIIEKICPILLPEYDYEIFTYDNIHDINKALKGKISIIKGGAVKYNSETIQTMIDALENIRGSENPVYDKDKVDEFITFLKDPNTKKLIEDGEKMPYNFEDTVDKINTNTLTDEGYVSLNIFNELLDTEIGHRLLKIFSGKTVDQISGIIYKSEESANNGDILDDNSFGFKKGDIVLISVLECLDALRCSYSSNKPCCSNPGSVVVNVNTPITQLRVTDNVVELETHD
ncbi:unknown similar to AMEV214 [Mythimna separata entomopoxvirus 'L']|uniref:Uncharacterized protein n=1 Tax=Mythimna separata entomopoxvirus 'L' TaxID=1293572 RepID=A0A916P228_9POXV|nr:unknown similar to AMEV214 [Mythimna separata entomopoxvirus 'L']CCU56440.1 unknown similar to AMEV214 [Mythimna separata entomopoxvirus 'L']